MLIWETGWTMTLFVDSFQPESEISSRRHNEESVHIEDTKKEERSQTAERFSEQEE
jgi:hypothetical protein